MKNLLLLFWLGFLPLGWAENRTEQLPALEYIQSSDAPAIPDDKIKFNAKSGTVLTISASQRPTLELIGTVGPDRQLYVGDTLASDDKGDFVFPIPLPPEPTTFFLRVVNRDRSYDEFQRTYYWVKMPPSIRLKVMEGDQVISKTKGYQGQLKKQAFTQLSSNGNSVSLVDLGTVRYAGLAFSITYPKETNDTVDGWSLTTRDDKGDVVVEIKKYGPPPAYVDFSEVYHKLPGPGRFSYRTDLYKDENIFEGAENHFEAKDGKFISEPVGMPGLYVEPKQEVGFMTVKNNSLINVSGIFAGIDVPFVFSNKYVLRAGALALLPTVNPIGKFTQTRIGAGMHAFDLLGGRFDFLLNYTSYSLSNAEPVSSFSHVGLLIEPHFLIGKENYVLGTLEIAGDTSFKEMRGALGASYQFYVRPWSMRLGMGFVYDRLFKYPKNPAMQFGAFRFSTSLTFII